MAGRHWRSENFISSGDLGGSFNSDPIALYRSEGFNIQLIFSGSPSGTFKLQSSDCLTFNPSDIPSNSWTDVADSDQSISAAGDHEWVVSDKYKWIRVVYTRTSGTGSVDGNYFSVEVY